MAGGAVGALGLWLFIGAPDRGEVGPGTFSSPDGRTVESEPGRGLAATDSATAADSAGAETSREPGADATRPPPAERVASTETPATPDASPRDVRPDELAPLGSLPDREETASGGASRSSTPARATGANPGAETLTETIPPGTRPTAPAAEPPERDAEAGERGEEGSVPATPVEARVAAEVALARYQHAIESADLASLRAAHPGITPENEAAWREVFENGETFVALLRITDFRATGSEARAEIRGSCHFYDLSLRRFVDVPVAFDLYLHHDGRRWRPVLASGETPEPAP